jgi:Tol biopolymer transport system component
MKLFLITLFLSQMLPAQIFSGFGRNKIQYFDLEWYILKTEHFDIYYYPEMEDLAKKGAFFAEESFKIVSEKFNHVVKRRIPLIFYSTHKHFQQTNITPGFIPEGVGGFFEFLKGRVVIPGNGNMNQFKKVIRHELVHVFMHEKVLAMNKQYKGYGLFPPLWFSEGLAEIYSLEKDPNAEMVIKDAVLSNYIPSLDEMFRIRGTYTMYKVGENLLRYIAEHYGEEKIQQLISDMWKYKRFKDLFENVIGESTKKFSKKWQYSLKKKYYPMLKDYDFADLITDEVDPYAYNFKPIYYKKNNEIIFWSNRTGYTGIYRKSLNLVDQNDDNDDVEVILTGEKSGDFESFSIFSNRLTVNSNDILAFSSKTQGTDALYFYDLNMKQIINKVKFKDLVSVVSPNFHPSGDKLVFSGLERSGYSNLYIYDLTADKLEKLTDDFYDDIDPTWSADGGSIYFSSDRTDLGSKWAYNIFSFNVSDKKINYVSYGKHRDLTPLSSPSGKYIAFVSDRNDQKNLYLIPSESSEKDAKSIKLTNFTSSVFDFDWVGDDKIVFTAFQNGRFKTQLLENILENKDETGTELTYQENNQVEKETYTANSWEIPKIASSQVLKKNKYEEDYAIDVAYSQVSQDPIFGTVSAAAIGISDMLGDERYIIHLYNNATRSSDFFKSFNFKVTKFSLGQRINYGYGIYRFAGIRYNYRDYYDEEEIGADFLLHYPFDQFRRLEFYSNLRYSEREADFRNSKRFSWLNTSYVSYVKDNSIWGATGPMDGERFKVSLSYTQDFVNNNFSYYTFLADYRRYFRTSARTSYSVRGMTMINNGRGARLYAIGGSWDLRGYDFLSLRGEKLAFISQEFRFPFLDFFGFKFASGPALGSNYINGAVFLDVANVFGSFSQPDLQINKTFGSFGLGVRMNFLGAVVFRFDLGKKTDFKSIPNSTFFRFFFGWDF